MPSLLDAISTRFMQTWKYSLASSVALAISWIIAQKIFGHEKPLFAAITSVICLAPGIPSHVRQAGAIILGVATGIIVGELVLLTISEDFTILRFIVASFLAMTIAALYGLRVVVTIQAGVSAMLVMAMGPITAGPQRMIDVLIGASVGLLFSQILITPDPIGMIDKAARKLLQQLSAGFDACLTAIEARDQEPVMKAQETFASAHDQLNALGTGISNAKDSARWSLRGRFVARKVHEMASRHNRHALRLFASTLLFADTLFYGLRDDPQNMPEDMAERTRQTADWLQAIRDGKPGWQETPPPAARTTSPQWQACNEALHAVQEALLRYQEIFVLPPQEEARA